MTKILNRFTENLICEDALLELKQLTIKNKANLWNADLRDANLRGADLWDADLWDANLRGADLWDADLRDANLRGANLRDADLRGANLRGANLRGADLRGAKLRGAKIDEKKIMSYKDINGVGNSRRQLRCFMFEDGNFYFMAGCFRGYEKELKKQVLEKYGKDCEYIDAIEFLKKICQKYQLEN